jgi:hypothetical protein
MLTALRPFLSREADNLSANEVSRILCNQKVHYRVHKNPHWYLSWATWLHSTPSRHCLFKIHFNIVLTSTTRFPKGFRLKFYTHFNLYNGATFPAHLPWFNYLNWMETPFCDTNYVLVRIWSENRCCTTSVKLKLFNTETEITEI